MDFDVVKYIEGEYPFVEIDFRDFDIDDSILVESSLIEVCPNDFNEAEYM